MTSFKLHSINNLILLQNFLWVVHSKSPSSFNALERVQQVVFDQSENGTIIHDNDELRLNFEPSIDFNIVEPEPIQFFDYPELSSSINHTANPCENFYEFVCAGWIANHGIDEDKSVVDQFQLASDKIEANIMMILNDRKSFRSLPPYDKMIFDLYDACMDSESRSANGGKPVIELLRSLKRSNDNLNVTDWLIKVNPLEFFFSISVVPDIRNSTQNILTLDTVPILMKSEKYYLDAKFDKQLNALKEYLSEILRIFSNDDSGHYVLNNSTEESERRVASYIEVEMAIAKLINESDKHYDNVFAAFGFGTLGELDRNDTKKVNLPRYLQEIMPKKILEQKYPDGLELVELAVTDLELVKNLDDLASNFSEQVLSDYMDFKVLLNEIIRLDDRYAEANFKFEQTLSDAKKRPPKWQSCKNRVMAYFSPLVERVYLKRFFDTEGTRTQMNEIFANIFNIFKDILATNNWLDDETKSEAFRKIDALKYKVAYMDKIFNDTYIDELYGELSIHSGQTYVEMLRNIDLWDRNNNFLELLKPVDVDFNGLEVNAFMEIDQNLIVSQSGILQGPFFNPNRPSFLNYAGIGAVIGHEITHGFDNDGRQFDHKGNIRDWWNNATSENFARKKKCLIEQYDAIEIFPEKKLNISGQQTQGENIADNGGIKTAFLALEKLLSKDPKLGEIKVRGLENFTPAQMFFINYAFLWCSKERPASVVNNLLTDEHSPSVARVNVALGNMQQFSEHFKCPTGSPMNPVKKCSVW